MEMKRRHKLKGERRGKKEDEIDVQLVYAVRGQGSKWRVSPCLLLSGFQVDCPDPLQFLIFHQKKDEANYSIYRQVYEAKDLSSQQVNNSIS